MIRWQTFLVFILVAGLAVAVSAHRFADSSHAIGLLNLKGGKARHPFQLETGCDRYTLIMTGTVLPPLRGDVTVALEGLPAMDYVIYNAEPIIRLGLRRHFDFNGATLQNLQPGDRFALWVVMRPEAGTDHPSPNETSQEQIMEHPADIVGRDLALNFYRSGTAEKLLQVPVLFTDMMQHGGAHGG